MKNKMMTYFLGFLVLSVWGLIIYKVFKATAGDDDQPGLPTPIVNKGQLTDYSIPKDTTHLMLNYRDPFSTKKSEPVEIPISQLVHKSVLPKIQKPAVNWNFIKYSGFIHNPGSKKLIAMININGKELMMSEGEMAEQVKLIKNLKDSVKISYQGTTKFITLNKSL